MGEGRNTIFLAQQGWDATGVDLSDVAVKQAKAKAAQLNVKLTAIVDNLDDYELGESRWDLIAMFYIHAWYHSARVPAAERLVRHFSRRTARHRGLRRP